MDPLRKFGRILLEEAPAVAVGILVFFLLKGQVLDAYKVPTPSMEPTILGDGRQGDVVLVGKTAFHRAAPSRHEMVVFRRPEYPFNIVKRVVGMPGEWLHLRGGDVWTGPSRDRLEILRKCPVEHRDLLVAWWDSAAVGEAAEAAEVWHLDGPGGPATWEKGARRLLLDGRNHSLERLRAWLALDAQRPRSARPGQDRLSPAHLSLRMPVDTGYLGLRGRRVPGQHPVDDAGLMVRVVPQGPGAALHLTYEAGDHLFTLEYAPDGTLVLLYGDSPADRPRAPEEALPVALGAEPRGRAPPLEPRGTREVVFLYLDGAFQAAVDGEVRLVVPLDLRFCREEVPRFVHRGPHNRLHAAAAGGALRVARLMVLRDLYYTDKHLRAGREPEFVPEGHHFVLGDNSRDSTDSRNFGPIPADSILGRPLAVASPLHRARVFPR